MDRHVGWFGITLQKRTLKIIRIRDNYPEYDLVPLPAFFDLEWTEKAAEILNDLIKDIISRLDHRDTLFFEEFSELLFNGLLPRRARSRIDEVTGR